ncbi:MAG: prepilin peptidase, partial [Deltaproteobacteria bacterium]|nr:prepilin peptidase [Deltaproteobacteria bacterium]
RESVKDRDRAIALVREVTERKTGLKPFAVQVAGALSLESGFIAEMATGEGKTLTAAMCAVIAGWRGRGCHVVTANDYLAKRDAESMAPVYDFCGLDVAYIQQDMPPEQRRQAYHCDITYCTNKEVAADFLRDQLVIGSLQGSASAILEKIAGGSGLRSDRLVQRGLECAIVDEADSVLIDEAMTPLIISGNGPNQEQLNAYERAAKWAGELDPACDFSIDRQHREIDLTSTGKERLAELVKSAGGIWVGSRRREELIVQALSVREFFIRGKQYVVEDGKVLIVDEFTGRLMPDRSWQNGIHQAIEAKEGVEINLPKETFARISFQRFFRLYRKLSGMTGTGSEAKTEFWRIYHLPVVVIPTNRPCIRHEIPDHVFLNSEAKWAAVVQEIRRVHETGRPILIGTRSVRASEHLSDLLKQDGLAHRVLNAVRHEQEAEIVAEAGQKDCITVATNMAGRGTDIKLGEAVANLGGLHVIATERHEAGRIDRQLYGRGARQGDPGSAQAFVSLDDELLKQHARVASSITARYYKYRKREISSRLSRWLFNFAQHRAERLALRQRTGVLRADKWMDEHLGFAGKGF